MDCKSGMRQSESMCKMLLMSWVHPGWDLTISVKACESTSDRCRASYIIQNTAGIKLTFFLRHVSEVDFCVNNKKCLRLDQIQVLKRENVGIEKIDLRQIFPLDSHQKRIKI